MVTNVVVSSLKRQRPVPRILLRCLRSKTMCLEKRPAGSRLHANVAVADGELAFVTSANFTGTHWIRILKSTCASGAVGPGASSASTSGLRLLAGRSFPGSRIPDESPIQRKHLVEYAGSLIPTRSLYRLGHVDLASGGLNRYRGSPV